MKIQGNTTEIDERNLLRLDALLSHGYGLSPQLVMNRRIAFVRFYHFTPPRPYCDRIDIRSCRQRREPMRGENK